MLYRDVVFVLIVIVWFIHYYLIYANVLFILCHKTSKTTNYMVWVLNDLVRGLTQSKLVPSMIGWDSDPYVSLSIGKIPLLLGTYAQYDCVSDTKSITSPKMGWLPKYRFNKKNHIEWGRKIMGLARSTDLNLFWLI